MVLLRLGGLETYRGIYLAEVGLGLLVGGQPRGPGDGSQVCSFQGRNLVVWIGILEVHVRAQAALAEPWQGRCPARSVAVPPGQVPAYEGAVVHCFLQRVLALGHVGAHTWAGWG